VRGYDGETDRFVLEPAIVRKGSLEGGAP
jgi:hypothetical protein